MSASAILTGAVLVLVAFILWREHKKQASTSTPGRQAKRLTLTDDAADQWLKSLPAQLEPHRLPVVRITPIAEAPATPRQSRFGGHAWWPEDLPYPTTPDGTPLHLLAQLNLDEMPSLGGYPDTGMLQFFIANEDLMGLQFPSAGQDIVAVCTAPLGFRVVYHPEVAQEPSLLRRHDTRDENQEVFLPVDGCYALRFEADSMLPAPTDHRFDALVEGSQDLPDETLDALYDHYSAEGCHLGGYATFTQDDPRYGQTPGDWLLLFQMDTTEGEGVHIMWGDSGVGNFFIHKDDLARRDFSRVWYNWDCC